VAGIFGTYRYWNALLAPVVLGRRVLCVRPLRQLLAERATRKRGVTSECSFLGQKGSSIRYGQKSCHQSLTDCMFVTSVRAVQEIRTAGVLDRVAVLK